MSTTSLADLAVVLCMIPGVLMIYAVFFIPRYEEENEDSHE